MKEQLATHPYAAGFPLRAPPAGYDIMEAERELDTVDQQLRLFDLLTSPAYLSQQGQPQQQQALEQQQTRYQGTPPAPQFALSPPLASPVLASPAGRCPVTDAQMGPVDPLSDPLPLIRPDLLLEEPLAEAMDPPHRSGSDHLQYSPMQEQLELFQKMLEDSIAEEQAQLHTSQQQLKLLPMDKEVAALRPAMPWQQQQQRNAMPLQQQQQVQAQPQMVPVMPQQGQAQQWQPLMLSSQQQQLQQQVLLAQAASAPMVSAGAVAAAGAGGRPGPLDLLNTVNCLLQAQQHWPQQQHQQQQWPQQQQQGAVPGIGVYGPATTVPLAGASVTAGQMWLPLTSAAAAAGGAVNAPGAAVKMEVDDRGLQQQQTQAGLGNAILPVGQQQRLSMLAEPQAAMHLQQQQLGPPQAAAWGGTSGQPLHSSSSAGGGPHAQPSAQGPATPTAVCAPPGEPLGGAGWGLEQWGAGRPGVLAGGSAAAGTGVPQAALQHAVGAMAAPAAAAAPLPPAAAGASSSATGAAPNGGFKAPAAAAAPPPPPAARRSKSGTLCAPSSGSSSAQQGVPAAAGDVGGGGSMGAALGVGFSEEEEELMKGMTVMQRYHYKRKLNMQRMEQEVAAKLAQLTLLEKENKRLRWQARVLENMVADIDKQLEVMTAADSAAADPGQWIALLGMGRRGCGAPRPVHNMLEGAGRVDITTWQLEDFMARWTAYVQQLQPLMARVREARAAWLAHQGPQEAAEGAARAQAMQAAVAAAAANAAKAGGLEDTAASTGGLQQLVFGFMRQQQREEAKQEQRAVKEEPARGGAARTSCDHPTSSSTSSQGAEYPAGPTYELRHLEDGRCVWGGPGTEGVPLQLLCEVEGLVMSNFEWLLALLTRNHLATYQFVTADFEGSGRPAPPAGDPYWRRVVGALSLTPHQMQEASMCLQLATRCREQVRLERERLQQALEQQTGDLAARGPLLDASSRMEVQIEAVTAMQRNVWREAVVRNMVGLYCINVLTLLDLATISVESYPFFCNAWAVIGAVAEVLREQQAAPAAAAAAAASATAAAASAAAAASRGGEGQGAGAASVTTRSSARRARGK